MPEPSSKHHHYCACGRAWLCYNEACTEPDLCPRCTTVSDPELVAELNEQEQMELAAEGRPTDDNPPPRDYAPGSGEYNDMRFGNPGDDGGDY